MSKIAVESLGGGFFAALSKDHRFGTDAFLLADFAAAKHKDQAVDLGTGCGIIPLLLYKMYRPAHITGVELQSEAAALFYASAVLSGLQGKVTPICADLRRLEGLLPAGKFDLVTCNPPYEAPNTGKLNDSTARQLARHELSCTIGDACAAAFRLLKTGGRFCLCQRPGRLADVMDALRAHRLEPKRLRFVCQSPEREPWLFLIEGRKDRKPGLSVLPNLWMAGADGRYSAEILHIYGYDKDVTQ